MWTLKPCPVCFQATGHAGWCPLRAVLSRVAGAICEKCGGYNNKGHECGKGGR